MVTQIRRRGCRLREGDPGWQTARRSCRAQVLPGNPDRFEPSLRGFGRTTSGAHRVVARKQAAHQTVSGLAGHSAVLHQRRWPLPDRYSVWRWTREQMAKAKKSSGDFSEREAWKWFAGEYPKLAEHLTRFANALKNRQ